MPRARSAEAIKAKQRLSQPPSPSQAQKREEIIRVAARLFLEDGYDATSVQRIAAEVEVAPNTLYWYFADKDALLIGALDSLLARALAEYALRRKSSLEAQLLWLVDQLSSMRNLVATVHARAALSQALREWHEGFHQLVEAVIQEQLRAQNRAAGCEAEAAKTAMFVVEGMLAHDVAAAEQRRLVKWLVSREF